MLDRHRLGWLGAPGPNQVDPYIIALLVNTLAANFTAPSPMLDARKSLQVSAPPLVESCSQILEVLVAIHLAGQAAQLHMLPTRHSENAPTALVSDER